MRGQGRCRCQGSNHCKKRSQGSMIVVKEGNVCKWDKRRQMESCSWARGDWDMYSARPARLYQAADDEQNNDKSRGKMKWTMVSKSRRWKRKKKWCICKHITSDIAMFRFEDDVSASRSALLRACPRRLSCVAPPAPTGGHRRRWRWPAWRRRSADRQCCRRQIGALGVVRADGPRAHQWTGRCFNCGERVTEVACWMSARP